MKKLLIGILQFALVYTIAAKPVGENKALQMATRFLATQTGEIIQLKPVLLPDSLADAMYAFAAPKAYVIVSADDCATPILAYSTTSTFSLPIPDYVADWLYGYAKEIKYIRKHGIVADSTLLRLWSGTTLLPKSSGQSESANTVAPLLQTQWGQTPYYNAQCPSDGISGQAISGCVATATAQVMRYWSHPQTGTGSHCYTHSRYGILCANFGTTTYDWSNMPIRLTSSSTTAEVNAVATLMYHVGVAVDMNYSVSNSTASNLKAANALKTYFGYDPNIRYENKSNYMDDVWIEMLKTELMAGRPMLYRGMQYSVGGHSFVCDGFDNNGLFHFNWGWGGAYDNSYYYIGNLNPGRYNFSSDQAAVFGIMPMIDTAGIVTITAQANDAALGEVVVDSLVQGVFSIGDTVELIATAFPSARFVRWSDGVRDNPRRYIVSGNQNLFVAEFESIISDTMYYHNGAYRSYHTGQANKKWGIRFLASELEGRDTLNAIMLYKYNSWNANCNVFVYSGGLPADSTLIHSQAVSASVTPGWNTFVLDSAVVVPSGKALWILFDSREIPHAPYSGNMNGSIVEGNGVWKYNRSFSWLVNAVFSHSESWHIAGQTNSNLAGYVAGGGHIPVSQCQNVKLTAYTNEGYRFSHWADNIQSNPRYVNVFSDTSFMAYFEPIMGDTIHHDDGQYLFAHTGSWIATAFAPTVINGNNRINGLQLYSTTSNQLCHLRIYHGDANGPQTMLLDTTILSVSVCGWDNITLQQNIIIDTTQWLWLAFDGYTADAPMAFFSGDNHSRMYSTDDQTWSPMAPFGSLMLRAILGYNHTPLFTIHANADNSTHGSVMGSGAYLGGTSVALRAIPSTCYSFVAWSDGDTANPRQLTLSSDSSLTAYFVANTKYGEVFAEACDSYIWHGQTYTNEPQEPPTYTYRTSEGCDSIVALHLTLGHTTQVYDTIVVCDSIVWYDSIYLYSNNMLTHLIHPSSGCDTVMHLWLKVNPSKKTNLFEQACDSLQWQNHTYTSDTTAIFVTPAANGCDSVVSIRIRINNSLHSCDTVSACGYYYWHGARYDETPENPLIYSRSVGGCTQSDTLLLTVNQASSSTDSIEACDSTIWHGIKYTYTTTYPTYNVPEGNMYGCDSIVHLNLTIRNSSIPTYRTMYVCDSTSLYGETFFNDSTIYHVWPNANSQGCDSTERIMLHVTHTTHEASFMVTCGNYYWHGYYYTQTPDTLPVYSHADYYGCISTDTLYLTIHQVSSSTDTIESCDSAFWHGTKYTYSTTWPTYNVPEGNVYGCDSTVHLNLTIHHSSNSAYKSEYACDSILLFGQLFFNDSTILHVWPNANSHGCDSVERIRLYVTHTTHTATIAEACGNYYWHYHTYTQTPDTLPIYRQTNWRGCVNTDTLHLTINHPVSSTETLVVCDSCIWHGITYYNSTTTPSFTTTSSAGCDSVVTLHLTVNRSNSAIENVTACDGYTWHGIGYIASTSTPTYTTINGVGCDSVVTLHLTVNQSTDSVETTTACDSFTWIDGNTYTEGNDTTQFTIYNSVGCDSLITLHLTINHSTSSSATDTACDGYSWNGMSYTTSGTYSYTTNNAVGCDSTITLTLTLNNSAQTAITDTADESYFWHGETITESGTYQWQGTTVVGCDSTVTLTLVINHVGIDTIDDIIVNVYPNPTNGWLTIDADDVLSVEVFDQTGRKITSFKYTNRINLGDLMVGTYILKIHNKKGYSIHRIILN